ncbi:MAG: hypothetical protein ACOYLG_10630, partial [Chitinophagaceae bacterium]
LVLKILIERPTSETCLRFGFGFEQPEAGYARFQIFLNVQRAKAENGPAMFIVFPNDYSWMVFT